MNEAESSAARIPGPAELTVFPQAQNSPTTFGIQSILQPRFVESIAANLGSAHWTHVVSMRYIDTLILMYTDAG